MTKAKIGDTVRVHYTGKLADGTIFDTSEDREPLEFKIGDGQLIPGFEQAIVGLKPGESTSVIIPAEDAYGSYDEDLVQQIDRNKLPDDLEPRVGQQLEAIQGDGKRFVVIISEVTDSSVTIDANHPLAGKDLNFEIKLLEIV
ncbi:MAG TPA: peptidylprolyl isomerase [Bacteroidetes bacterium]|nr:peptidylprolyl isomerase [Bacteroidota bacterium]